MAILRQLVFLVLSSFVSARMIAHGDPTVAVGSHIIYSYPGYTVPQSLLDLIVAGKVGGVILFGENVDANTPAAMKNLQITWSKSPVYNGVPLLIMTDQEGGIVARLPGGPTESEKQVGSSKNPSAAATNAGEQAAATLKNYNNNANLAPVCGVYRQAGDFLDKYQRSYSNNATIVSDCVREFVTAQQGAGVIATAKHFPGLGAATASQDTDAGSVTLNLSLSELRQIDEIPFIAAIDAKIEIVMPSWAIYPALDPDNPAGVSSKWMQDELRSRLGFLGVTISDAIEAGALAKFGADYGARGVLAARAGMDIILASARDVNQGSIVFNALMKALSDGTLDAGKFNDATDRIINLRKKFLVA